MFGRAEPFMQFGREHYGKHSRVLGGYVVYRKTTHDGRRRTTDTDGSQ